MDTDDFGDITICEEYPSFAQDEVDDFDSSSDSYDDLDITCIFLGDAFNDAAMEFNESDLFDEDEITEKEVRQHDLSKSLSDHDSSSGSSESDTTLVAHNRSLDQTVICEPTVQSKYTIASSGRKPRICDRRTNQSENDQENLDRIRATRVRKSVSGTLTSTPLKEIRAIDVTILYQETSTKSGEIQV